MDTFESRTEAKLDKLAEVQAEQSTTLTRCVVTLEEHVRRTGLLEEEQRVTRNIAAQLAASHQRWVGAGKAFAAVGATIGALAALVAVAEGIVHVLGHIQ